MASFLAAFYSLYSSNQPSLFKELLTSFTFPLLSIWMWLCREFPFSVTELFTLSQMAAHFNSNQSTTTEKIPCYSWVFVWWRTDCFFAFNSLTANLSHWLLNSFRATDGSYLFKIYLFPALLLLIKCLVAKLQMNQCSIHVIYKSTEKWTGMKHTGLKIPEKDQIYV